jgi:hypothetical protein
MLLLCALLHCCVAVQRVITSTLHTYHTIHYIAHTHRMHSRQVGSAVGKEGLNTYEEKGYVPFANQGSEGNARLLSTVLRSVILHALLA